jgi:capsular polysaccharide transport system permease protein
MANQQRVEGDRMTHRASKNRGKMVLATPRIIIALILREIGTSYGRSPGGYIWALAEPVLGIALLTAIFSIGFRTPPLGNNFPIFYATGLLPFLIFVDLSNKISQAISYSKQLLAYPRVTFVDAILGRFILNFLTQLLVGFIVLSGIILLFDTRAAVDISHIMSGLALIAALSLGVGVFNCFMMSMFQVWQRIYGICTRPLLLLSGVVFMYDTVPEPYRGYLWYNPLIHVVGRIRAGFYHGYDATYISPAYVYAVAATLGLFGLLLLRRYHRDILER